MEECNYASKDSYDSYRMANELKALSSLRVITKYKPPLLATKRHQNEIKNHKSNRPQQVLTTLG